MACPESIPAYLYRNDRPHLPNDAFLNAHRLYSVQTKGNPVRFPNTLTAISCKWSHIINEEDVIHSNEPPIGDDFKYAIVGEINQLRVSIEKNDGGVQEGLHTLTSIIEHTPYECEYSHSEIFIRHIYTRIDEYGNEVVQEHIISYDDWSNKNTILTKGNSAISRLKGDYRLGLIKLFSYPQIAEPNDNENIEPAQL